MEGKGDDHGTAHPSSPRETRSVEEFPVLHTNCQSGRWRKRPIATGRKTGQVYVELSRGEVEYGVRVMI